MKKKIIIRLIGFFFLFCFFFNVYGIFYFAHVDKVLDLKCLLGAISDFILSLIFLYGGIVDVDSNTYLDIPQSTPEKNNLKKIQEFQDFLCFLSFKENKEIESILEELDTVIEYCNDLKDKIEISKTTNSHNKT